MSLPWHIPLEGITKLQSSGDVVQPSLLKHYANIDIHGNPAEELLTGLMCDIGASNREPGTIQRLIAAGMTVARLTIRDMEPDACAQLIQSIRQAVYNYSAELKYVYPLAVVVDVRSPNIVTGVLKGGPSARVELIQHETIRLTTDAGWRQSGTAECLYVGWDHLTYLQPGDLLFIDSLTPGSIKLVISEIGDDSIECCIATGGTIGSKMTVRLSHSPREVDGTRKDSMLSITSTDTSSQAFEQVEDQVSWAVAVDSDALLVSGAQVAQDVRHVRDLLSEKGKHILVIASIDTVLGLDNAQEILDEADGIYLDRSLLSIDLSVEKVFIAQKLLMAKCNSAGKPCLCKAVINEQVPTLCVTDVANLVLDGADVLALELHYETPLNKFGPAYDPVRMAEQCLVAAGVICKQAERVLWQPRTYGNLELMQSPLAEPSKSVCVSAVELAMRSRAVAIICLTNSGRTARILSHARPACPVVAVSRTCHTARQMRFWRGVRSMHYFDDVRGVWASEVQSRVNAALDYCKIKGIVRAGDAYVTLSGSRRGVGYCDAIRLLYASALNTITVDYN